MDKDVKEAFQVLVNKLDDILATQKELHDFESKMQAKSLIVIKKLFQEHAASLADLRGAVNNMPELQEIVKALA
jgi:hypothetical protein